MTRQRASEAFELLKQGRHTEARSILEEIVADDNADAVVLETLGDVREKLGERDGALDAYAGAVTHLRARGEHRRALSVIELMLIVDDTFLATRSEAAQIRRDLGDEAGCWREVVAGCDIALGGSALGGTGQRRSDVAFAVGLAEEHADVLPEAAPGLAVARRLEGCDRREAARLSRTLAEALKRRGKPEEARKLSALAVDLEPALKDLLHARGVPSEERGDEPWSDKTPEVPMVPAADDPTDLER